MPPPWLAGLLAPAVALASGALAWFALGPAWGFAALGAGLFAVALYHLVQLEALTRWAAGGLEAVVPEGRGVWRHAFAAIYQRVRERMAVQRDLAQSIARFRGAAEALPDGMVVLDAHNRIEWANIRAQQQLAISPDTDTGSPLANLVREPGFVRYLEGGDFTGSVIVPSQREAGVTLSIQLVPFGVDERLLICRDITQVEAVARMRRDFIANVSHELKTPLTVVSGFVETMQDLDLDEKQRRRYLQLMQEQSRNMQRLVADLLTLSALENDQNPLPDTEFAVVPLALELSADAKALSRGEHEIALDIGEAASVSGSRDELASAFANLVSNAIRYTPAGGRIVLSWQVDEDGSGVFSVTDNGIGIAPEHIPRLTERFYRVDRSRSRATGGTGLGLAIVKHVLLRHQAELEVTSELGRGSTFAVRLPARRVRRPPADVQPLTDPTRA
jgi:two-component system phosphate regulon sensor histidine kinase PhoR